MNNDLEMMQHAIDVGEKSRWISPPNPWVGCVLAKDGVVIGEGSTSTYGGPHAEVNALKKTGNNAHNSTMYVTLEPCCHFGKTPPCTDSVIRSGVKKVVIGIQDPDPLVSGKGIKLLKEAGIEVVIGIAKEKVEESLQAYIHHRLTKKPFVVAKCAVSLDGRIAAKDGTSQWISSEEALQDAQALRASSQAILVGAKTALLDKPRLTVRVAPLKPLRVLVDAKGIVPADGPLFDADLGPLLIATSENSTLRSSWEKRGAEILTLPSAHGKLNFNPLLEVLGKKGVLQLLVEGGGYTLGAFLEQNLLHSLIVYQSPIILGDEGIAAFQGLDIPTFAKSLRFQLTDYKILGNTFKFTLRKE